MPWFDFKKEALKLKPNVIICHGLRKPYLKKAVNIAKKIGAKCFLITHAPFIDKELRNKKVNLMIKLYDYFLGKGVLNSFDKVISICKWEKDELINLGCDENRIQYIPNSLSDEFFTKEKGEEKKKILYLGRMHPVKELEVLMKAFENSKLEGYTLEIVGSNEGNYFNYLQEFITKGITFTRPIYDLNKKIEKIDSCEIFVLPSRKESLPFGLIEAMSRGKIVVTTKTKGGLELVKNLENGFLFDIGDITELELIFEIINKLSEEQKEKIRLNAKEKAKDFMVSKTMEKWEDLFNG